MLKKSTHTTKKINMNEEWKWKIIESMFQEGIIQHQIQSYDQFVHSDLERIVNDESEINIALEGGKRYVVCFTEPYLPGPCVTENRELKRITPDEARIREFYYDSPLYVDIQEHFIDEHKKLEKKIDHKRVMIARIPVMIGSSICTLYGMTPEERIKCNECIYDKGGYFIIKGKERVLVTQCRNIYNRVVVIQQNILKKAGCKYIYTAEMRSMSNETGHSVPVAANFSIDNRTITVSIPYVSMPIPAVLVLRALGVDEGDVYNLIGIKGSAKADKLIKNMMRDASFAKTRDETLEYIGQFSIHVIPKEKRVAYARQVVETEIFPHLGVTATLKEKAVTVGFMLNRLISTAVGLREPDDRDNYTGKRVETSGILIEELFRTLFKRFIKNLNLQLQRRQDVLIHITKSTSSITQGLRHSFATGSWGVQKNAYIRTGVSQVLSRMSFSATLSHLRRMNLPIGKEGKNAKIRQIHTSQFGFIDPSETPEGQQVGTVLNLALSTRVTKTISHVLVRETLMTLTDIQDVQSTSFSEMKDLVKVFLNGVLLGFTADPNGLIERIRYLKNNDRIDKSISAFYDEDISIFCDKGRLVRPLFTVENGSLRILSELYKTSMNDTTSSTTNDNLTDWNDLVEKDYIRYVDCGEIEASNIAMTPEEVTERCHYCEIHPSLILGVCASTIPFPANTQSPRNCYSASMGKQALSFFASSHQMRADTVTHVLDYPAKPIAKTKASVFMGFDDMPCGINAIVAIMCYTGRNQEDSVIMNKSAIDRGLFVATSYRTMTSEEKKRGAYMSETIEVPEKQIQVKGYDYSKLDPTTGIIRKGLVVKKGDVLIAKVLSKSNKSGETERVDCSVTVKAGDEGTVDRVFDMKTQHGYRLVKVVIRKRRIPEMGDKVASRAGQKGTIGMIFPQEDMPFTEQGIVPDIIINSHCIPSRMTANQLIEAIVGKSGVIKGKFTDATPFTPSTVNMVDRVCNELLECGFQKRGLEVMYSGITGEKIEAQIFIGPTYYQRLKHMVSDKIHSRATGSVTMMTHQPLEGRSQEGGLRFGEMERDCMIVHGGAKFLKERLFDMSDPYTISVCKNCKLMTKSQKSCHSCADDRVVSVNLPYAAKLLFTELQAMGIKIFIDPEE